ncbi:hypothetical protein ACFVSW_21500 [Neobacillus sp. NPDC058068]|uniref:hypothetical protein n=1 Tax=Neobacillus sp. NPDC058068 TaxID=3346325 RepID=UPI0036DED745
MFKIRNFIWILTTIVMSMMLLGCSADEVIRVGTPYNYKGTDGVKFDTEITNSEAISKLRTIINHSKEIEKPDGIENLADVYFSLDRPKEGIGEIVRYMWYQDDGSSILSSGDYYYTLTKEQTGELKGILEGK